MVKRLKNRLKLLETIMDAIRQGLTVKDIKTIFKTRAGLNKLKAQRKAKDKE